MNGFWKKVAALCIAAAAIAASVTLATAATDGNGDNSSGNKPRIFRAPPPPGPDEHLSALAKQLDVSTSKLRDALDAVRQKLGRPEPPSGRPPSRSELEKRCNEFTDALAKELGKSADEVRAANKAVIKAEIEDAVKDGRLTQAQADKAIERIGDAPCLPLFGPHVGARCGPPPGMKRGSGNSGNSDSTLPAPPPGAPMLEFGPAA